MPLQFTSGQSWTLMLNLLVAAALGGIIGLEREAGHRPAGLRTYMLVSLGSCLFTILSIQAFPIEGATRDTARVAAQVVVGIGFIGAGTVWRSQDAVKGLTTAAGLWVAAAIGMAVGTGFMLLAAATTIIVLLILTVLRRFERTLRRWQSSDRMAPTAPDERD